MDKIAVLIPCYNESKTVKKVIENFKKELPNATIYVYDNNSTDGTDKIAKESGAIVRYETRQGKGNVIRTMFREIDAEVYLMVDGDNTYPSECAKELCDGVLNENCDMVIGDRLSSTYFKENKRVFHNFGNKLVRKLINKLFKGNIKDVMTGYRAFSYRFVKTFPILSKNFEIETEMTIHALDKNLKIKNVVIEYKDREEGSESKLNTYKDGTKVLGTIVNLYKNYKPLHFFNIVSTILFVIGLILLIPVLIEYFSTGLVPKFPTFIASCIFLLMSIQSFFGGLILDNMNKIDRRNFEITYNEFSDKEKKLKEE